MKRPQTSIQHHMASGFRASAYSGLPLMERQGFQGGGFGYRVSGCRVLVCRGYPESPIPLNYGINLKSLGASYYGLS